MDYQKLYEQAQKEHAKLSSEKAIQEEKIKELVNELGLDPEKDLSEQVELKLTQIQEQMDKNEEELKSCVAELESLNIQEYV